MGDDVLGPGQGGGMGKGWVITGWVRARKGEEEVMGPIDL